MEHELKTDPAAFDAVFAGQKSFELRFDDRNYQVADELILRRTQYTGQEMRAGAPLRYVGSPFHVYVIHILRGPIYGLEAGWVIMSISPRDTVG